MDFLLLLPNSQRIVIEVDGSQHFSRDGRPSLAAYSEMTAADRDLRLAGYGLPLRFQRACLRDCGIID
jgi:hypothetical protein